MTRVINIKTFVPLIVVQCYLLFSLLLLKLGPIEWKLENEFLFWVYICTYHVSFLLGYFIAVTLCKSFSISQASDAMTVNREFKILIWLAFIASLIGHRNLAHTPSYLPVDFIKDLISGISDPAGRYYYKLSPEAQQNFSGNKLVTAFFAFFAFARFSLLPFIVFYWNKLGFYQRLSGFLVVLLAPLSGVSVGTNKPFFDFVFVLVLSTLIPILRTKRFYSLKIKKQIAWQIMVFLVLVATALGYFKLTQDSRVGHLDYIESTSIKGNISVSEIVLNCAQNSTLSGICATIILATGYLVQGYYGMSLALDEPFDSTFGLGSSHVLLRWSGDILGINLVDRTFQYKITSQWNSLGQWHSAYSQIANDVGFFGVSIIILLFAGVYGYVWKHYVLHNDFISLLLVILFSIGIAYIPANNQLLNNVELLFATVEIFFFWVFTRVFRLKLNLNSRS